MTMTRSAVTALVLLLTVSCGGAAAPPPSLAPSPPSPSPAGPERDEAKDGSFRLTIESDRGSYRAGEAIDIAATLTYLGPRDMVVASGSGSGLVIFTIDQLDGTRDMGAVATTDCRRYQLRRGEAQRYAFTKSAAFSESDPHAGFWRSFLAEPELRLPVGRWRITAQGSFYTGDCGDREHRLSASVTIDVVG